MPKYVPKPTLQQTVDQAVLLTAILQSFLLFVLYIFVAVGVDVFC